MVYREVPKCMFCGESIAKGIYQDYTGWDKNNIPFGDSFLYWEYLDHTCEQMKQFMELNQDGKSKPLDL